MNVQGEQLPLALLIPYLPERDDGRAWLLNGGIDLVARVLPAGNAWRGTASVTSASGGLRNSARSRRDLVGYRGFNLAATFDPHRRSRIQIWMGIRDRRGAADCSRWQAWSASAYCCTGC